MVETSEDLSEISTELRDIRASVSDTVQVLADELLKREGMNDLKAHSICAQLDLAVRNFEAFAHRANKIRMEQEAEAKSRDELLYLRRFWGSFSAQLSLTRVELNRWTLIRNLVQLQVRERNKRIPLYPATIPETHRSQVAASDEVFDWLHGILNPESQSESAQSAGCFADIALPNSEFHQHLHAAYRVLIAMDHSGPKRFLDVGCGGGLKVLTALRYFDEVSGFDFQASYVSVAEDLMRRGDVERANVFEADALLFEGYGDFEVIYFYRPIRDEEKLIEMEKRIVDMSKPGAILIAPYLGFGHRYKGLGCGHVDGHVYVAKTSQTAADRLRRRAAKTGVAVVRDAPGDIENLWSPLLSAARKSGYEVERFLQPV